MEYAAPGILDITNADRRVWLVKVPDYLSERLNELEEDGLDIGSVRIYKATQDTPAKVMVKLAESGPCGDMPKDYSMAFSKCDQKMHLFSEDIAGRATRIEGRVDKEFYMKPVMNDEYRQVMSKRREAASRPKRTIQMVTDIHEPTKLGLIKHHREQDLIRAQKARIVPDERRERLPKKDVMDILFKAFERMPHWNFTGLVQLCQQPTVYLKEILGEIAVYNKRGPYKNLYELKPEYKTR